MSTHSPECSDAEVGPEWDLGAWGGEDRRYPGRGGSRWVTGCALDTGGTEGLE